MRVPVWNISSTTTTIILTLIISVEFPASCRAPVWRTQYNENKLFLNIKFPTIHRTYVYIMSTLKRTTGCFGSTDFFVNCLFYNIQQLTRIYILLYGSLITNFFLVNVYQCLFRDFVLNENDIALLFINYNILSLGHDNVLKAFRIVQIKFDYILSALHKYV